jgi:hypothetical protein
MEFSPTSPNSFPGYWERFRGVFQLYSIKKYMKNNAAVSMSLLHVEIGPEAVIWREKFRGIVDFAFRNFTLSMKMVVVKESP